MKTIAIVYGISVLLSFLLIRMGFALDEKQADSKTLVHWFGLMFVPFFNVIFSALASFRLLFKRMEKNNVAESFLKHLFLPRNKIKKK